MNVRFGRTSTSAKPYHVQLARVAILNFNQPRGWIERKSDFGEPVGITNRIDETGDWPAVMLPQFHG